MINKQPAIFNIEQLEVGYSKIRVIHNTPSDIDIASRSVWVKAAGANQSTANRVDTTYIGKDHLYVDTLTAGASYDFSFSLVDAFVSTSSVLLNAQYTGAESVLSITEQNAISTKTPCTITNVTNVNNDQEQIGSPASTVQITFAGTAATSLVEASTDNFSTSEVIYTGAISDNIIAITLSANTYKFRVTSYFTFSDGVVDTGSTDTFADEVSVSDNISAPANPTGLTASAVKILGNVASHNLKLDWSWVLGNTGQKQNTLVQYLEYNGTDTVLDWTNAVSEISLGIDHTFNSVPYRKHLAVKVQVQGWNNNSSTSLTGRVFISEDTADSEETGYILAVDGESLSANTKVYIDSRYIQGFDTNAEKTFEFDAATGNVTIGKTGTYNGTEVEVPFQFDAETARLNISGQVITDEIVAADFVMGWLGGSPPSFRTANRDATTGYSESTQGIWMGYSEVNSEQKFRFALGDGSQYIKWNGSQLSISGNVTIGETGGTLGQKTKIVMYYKAGTTEPDAPTGGTFANPAPTESGWTTSIPNLATEPENAYLSQRTFTSDGAAPQDTAWTAPGLFTTGGAQGGTGDPGPTGTAAEAIRLSADSQIFSYDNTGTLVGPTSINFTVNRQNIVANTNYSTSPDIGSGTSDTFTITASEFATAGVDAVVVSVTAGGLTDTITLTKVSDGINADIPTVTDNGNGTFTVDDGAGNTVVISDGDDGYSPIKGTDYFDGNDGSFVSFVYKNVTIGSAAPSTPTGGSFNGTTETIPTGFTDTASFEEGSITYMSETKYTDDGSAWSNSGWSTVTEFIIKGNTGAQGDTASVVNNGDGTYTVTGENGSITISDGTDAAIPTVTDNGNGTFTVDDGTGNTVVISDGDDGYSPIKGTDYFDGYSPIKGTDYFDGNDGSFVSFVYKNVTIGSAAPSTPTGGSFNGTTETIPTGFTDTASFEEGSITYMSETKYTDDGSAWSNSGWSTVTEFIIKGNTGAAGQTREVRFTYSATETGTYSSTINTWMKQGIYYDGVLQGNLSSAVRVVPDDGITIYTEFNFSADDITWNAIQGSTDVYIRSRTVTDGVSGDWSDTVSIKGNTGTTGKYFETRFAKGTTAPTIDEDAAAPTGWSTSPSFTLSANEYIWAITATKLHTGVLDVNWSTTAAKWSGDTGDQADSYRQEIRYSTVIAGTSPSSWGVSTTPSATQVFRQYRTVKQTKSTGSWVEVTGSVTAWELFVAEVGARGAGNYNKTNASWTSDSNFTTANVNSALPAGGPVIGDIVILSNTDSATWNRTARYVGGTVSPSPLAAAGWERFTLVINGNALVTGTVVADNFEAISYAADNTTIESTVKLNKGNDLIFAAASVWNPDDGADPTVKTLETIFQITKDGDGIIDGKAVSVRSIFPSSFSEQAVDYIQNAIGATVNSGGLKSYNGPSGTLTNNSIVQKNLNPLTHVNGNPTTIAGEGLVSFSNDYDFITPVAANITMSLHRRLSSETQAQTVQIATTGPVAVSTSSVTQQGGQGEPSEWTHSYYWNEVLNVTEDLADLSEDEYGEYVYDIRISCSNTQIIKSVGLTFSAEEQVVAAGVDLSLYILESEVDTKLLDYVPDTDARLTNARTPSLTGNLLTAVPAGALFTDTITTNFNTGTGTQPLEVSRSGSSTSQVMKVGVYDTAVQFLYKEDTSAEGLNAFGNYQFLLGGNSGEANIEGLRISKTGITAPNLNTSSWNTAYSWGDHASAGYQQSVSVSTPSITSTTVIDETIEIIIGASTFSGVDHYEVWSDGATGSDYSLIARIAEEDIASSMSVIDTSFEIAGTIAYRVYAVSNGTYSAAATTTQVFVMPTLDVLNLSIIPDLNVYHIEYNIPDTRFIDHIEIYVDKQAVIGNLARSNAVLSYSGNNRQHTYSISNSNLDNFHQFWVEIVST